jgi:hypothetical protein
MARATHLVELRQGFPDDLDSLPEVFLADDQRRGETDATVRISNGQSAHTQGPVKNGPADARHSHVNVRWLRQEPFALHEQTQLPSRPPLL